MARKRSKMTKSTKPAETDEPKVEPVVEVVDLSEAKEETWSLSTRLPDTTVVESVEDLVPAYAGVASKPDVAVHTLRQETGVDLTEVIFCNPMACNPEELGRAKQAETDGRSVTYGPKPS